MLSGEATNTNFIVVGVTRPGLEPAISRTREEHVNHYATDVVVLSRRPVKDGKTRNRFKISGKDLEKVQDLFDDNNTDMW